MQSQPDIEARRAQLVDMVARRLSPVAKRYGYAETPLEATIKWRPIVLILGNYSSGKSTLINELLGTDLQATGQAPTDDAFTVITNADHGADGAAQQGVFEREGTALIADATYPFLGLRRHGQRFAAHFRLKKVAAPILRDLAIIDTPGMLDSTAEEGRGYDYQAVIGDLAEIADLILVMFDPHKAGTVREAYASLRETLPAKTFEDRVLFVLNRIDECDSLSDLLRVYGTLCWNLSQMLGRKDIPPIRLTYAAAKSAGVATVPGSSAPALPEYLRYLPNQREDLRRQIEQAPRYRLDHLAAHAELHGVRLAHFLEALINYQLKCRRHTVKQLFTALGLALLGFAAATGWTVANASFADNTWNIGASAVFGLVLGILWAVVMMPILNGTMARGLNQNIDQLTPLLNQSQRDSWQAVRGLVLVYLETTRGKFQLQDVKSELAGVRQVLSVEIPAARAALAQG